MCRGTILRQRCAQISESLEQGSPNEEATGAGLATWNASGIKIQMSAGRAIKAPDAGRIQNWRRRAALKVAGVDEDDFRRLMHWYRIDFILVIAEYGVH